MNKVVHFEIPADDLQKAQEFYMQVFDWQLKPYGSDYFLATTTVTDENDRPIEAGSINGGIQRRGPRALHPTVVIEVENIDEVLEKIVANGGSIAIPKEEMGDMGFYAQFNDPENNRIGLFQKKDTTM